MHIHYYRTNNIRIAPSFTYFIERKGENMWMIDAMPIISFLFQLQPHYILLQGYIIPIGF